MCGVRPLVLSSLFLIYFSMTRLMTEDVRAHGTPPGGGQTVELNVKHTWLKHLLSLLSTKGHQKASG